VKTSATGREFIRRFEGFRANAYQCGAGRWTIGYGSTRLWGRAVHPDDTVTEAEAAAQFALDLGGFEADVLAAVSWPLSQCQFDSLVSFAYNVGAGALRRSTLVKLLNEGHLHEAADEFLRWDRAGGQRVPGLTRRRAAERALFLEDLQPHRPVPNLPEPGPLPRVGDG
jgi:lysozyme